MHGTIPLRVVLLKWVLNFQTHGVFLISMETQESIASIMLGVINLDHKLIRLAFLVRIPGE